MRGRIEVFAHKKISVWCYPEKGIIHHHIHEGIAGDLFRDALTKGIQAMQQYGGGKWLSDDRMNGALLPADLEWVDKVWFPQTVKAGWKFWALVPPVAVIGQMNIRRHVQLYKERGVTVQVFKNPEDAMRWLEAQ
jgi:hypothetical protein